MHVLAVDADDLKKARDFDAYDTGPSESEALRTAIRNVALAADTYCEMQNNGRVHC